MRLSRTVCAAILTVLLPAGLTAAARAQGVVLSPDNKPLQVKRARALLVFQERGLLAYQVNEPNRQDLLVELELARPAPRGALWVLACPPSDVSVLPGKAAVLDEVSAFWRRKEKKPLAEPWPAKSDASLLFGKAADAAGLPKLLAERGPAPDAALVKLLGNERFSKWVFFTAAVPEGAVRLGPAHLRCQPLVARYPGSLGAHDVDGDGWSLPALELMVLHSHFINVNDNSRGLEPFLNLGMRYRDSGTLQEGRPLWKVSRPKNPLEDPPAGRMWDEGLEAAQKFVGALGSSRSLFLTVVEGRSARATRTDLDFMIYSHYPSAVEPTGLSTGAMTLLACLVGVVILGRFLLKRKGFLE